MTGGMPACTYLNCGAQHGAGLHRHLPDHDMTTPHVSFVRQTASLSRCSSNRIFYSRVTSRDRRTAVANSMGTGEIKVNFCNLCAGYASGVRRFQKPAQWMPQSVRGFFIFPREPKMQVPRDHAVRRSPSWPARSTVHPHRQVNPVFGRRRFDGTPENEPIQTVEREVRSNHQTTQLKLEPGQFESDFKSETFGSASASTRNCTASFHGTTRSPPASGPDIVVLIRLPSMGGTKRYLIDLPHTKKIPP